MTRFNSDTPCPIPTTSHPPSKRLSAFSSLTFDDDTTQSFEHTQVVRQEFKAARPKRPRRAEKGVGVKIFEDVIEDKELVVDLASRRVLGGPTLLGRPARKIAIKTETEKPFAEIVSPIAMEASSTRHHLHAIKSVDTEDVRDGILGTKGPTNRDNRRRTIFVPSDDTTIMTIHPGANTTSRLDDTFHYKGLEPVRRSERSLNPASGSIHSKPARRPRMSLMAAPRRMPLQHTEVRSNNLPAVDMEGQKTGKENVPPGKDSGFCKNIADELLLKPKITTISNRKLMHRPWQSMAVPAVSTTSRTKTYQRITEVSPNTHPARPAVPVHVAQHGERPLGKGDKRCDGSSLRQVSKFGPTLSSTTANPKLKKYPILSENALQPELYCHDWLRNHEIALSQVINQILANAEPNPVDVAHQIGPLRSRIMDIYHRPAVADLHQRLHASLLYGVLSMPKVHHCVPDLTEDLGLRRRFLGLWLDSFPLQVVTTAAEVVVGRNASLSSTIPGSLTDKGDGQMDPHNRRRPLIGFLETFFVSVEDLEFVDSSDKQAKAIRRRHQTILRSLMLVRLLDEAKTTAVFPARLFKRTSTHKSSASVLRNLASMLLPWIGDVGKTLSRMNYSLSHTQDPLDEVKYSITNLAVDLRDGILLTRLAEIFFHSWWSSKNTDDGQGKDETLTLALPDATLLECRLIEQNTCKIERPISRHLKLPCLSRVHKMYNVQLALSALQTHPATKGLLPEDLTADDVVDGHREKTMDLLWSLVGTIGLEQLVDWDWLLSDTARMRTSTLATPLSSLDPILDLKDLNAREEELLAWAAAKCSLSGIVVTNLTTSFADGRAYNALASSLTTPSKEGNESPQSGNKAWMYSSLRSLGCSDTFVDQLDGGHQIIPTKAATTANLAFLASKILPLAQRHTAAATIQRAYRLRLARRTVKSRIVLMRLASDCAKVARAKQHIVSAAITLQQAWRNFVSARNTHLAEVVHGFQSLARGWSLRASLATTKRDTYGRVMAGW